MSDFADELKLRTKQFGLRVLKLVDALPRTQSAKHVGSQLMRSATSVGANYRAACRGRSKAEFAAKLGIVEEECDESLFWLEILGDHKLMKSSRLTSLQKEGSEILAIVVASIRTARGVRK